MVPLPVSFGHVQAVGTDLDDDLVGGRFNRPGTSPAPARYMKKTRELVHSKYTVRCEQQSVRARKLEVRKQYSSPDPSEAECWVRLHPLPPPPLGLHNSIAIPWLTLRLSKTK
jgi:hypothetical protein